MSVAYCKHDMVPEWCADCSGRVGSIDLSLVPVERGKVAQYEGYCRHCNDDFVVGETLITQCSAADCTHLDKSWVCCVFPED